LGDRVEVAALGLMGGGWSLPAGDIDEASVCRVVRRGRSPAGVMVPNDTDKGKEGVRRLVISMVRRPAVTISFGGASIGGGLVPGVGQRGFDPRGLRCDWEQPGWGRYRDTLSPTVASSVGDKRRQLPAEPTSGGFDPAALPCGAVSARRRRGTPHLSQKGSETNGRICCSPGRHHQPHPGLIFAVMRPRERRGGGRNPGDRSRGGSGKRGRGCEEGGGGARGGAAPKGGAARGRGWKWRGGKGFGGWPWQRSGDFGG